MEKRPRRRATTGRVAARVLRLVRRPASLALAGSILAAATIVFAAHEDGFSAQAVDLGSGSVWVASNGPGQLALLDGASGEVTVKLRVARDGDDVTAVTGPGAGYAVNRTTGTILRVDGATWNAGDAHKMIDGSTGGLTAVAGDRALFATDVRRGLAVRADPVSLRSDESPRSLSAVPGPGSPVLDRRGVLWLLDAQKGNLIRMTDSPQIVQSGMAGGATGRLVLVDDRPVVVDLAAGTAVPIDPDDGGTGRSVCVDVDPRDSSVRVVGNSTADQLYTVSGADGVLRISDLDTGDCSATVPDIASPGSDLGQPVQAGRHVFVPDYSTGQVIVVDLDIRAHTATPSLVDPGSDFELLDRDGFAFYNVRASDKAGVVDPDGSVRTVAKYDVDDPGKGVFVPQPSTGAGQTSTGGASADVTAESATAGGGATTAGPPVDGRPTGLDGPPDTVGEPTGDTVGEPTGGTVGPAGGPTIRPAPPTTTTTASSTRVPTIPVSPTSSSPSSPPNQGASSAPTSSPDGSSPTNPTDPTGAPPRVDGIIISSFPNDGRFLSGDVLTFAADVGGGTPDTWSWTLRYANDDGTPQAPVEHASNRPAFDFQVDSGGSSFQKWIVDVTVSNAAGSAHSSRVFQVDYVDGRQFRVTAVNASPNPVVTGAPVIVAPTIQGPLLSCRWWIEDGTGTRVTQPAACDAAQTAPGVGSYTVLVSAVSRQNTSATGSQSLPVKNIDRPAVSACTPPADVGAHETATVTATSSGQVDGWHWQIQRGNPLQDAGFTGTTTGSFSFTPTLAGPYRAEVWVSNAGGDSAHQTCDFTVRDRTPPDTHTVHKNVTEQDRGMSAEVTLAASDPESAVHDVSLTVYYTITDPCKNTTSRRLSKTETAHSGTVSVTVSVGSCLDTSPGAPIHSFESMIVSVQGTTSSATSDGGTTSWTN